jgi:amidohydrolase
MQSWFVTAKSLGKRQEIPGMLGTGRHVSSTDIERVVPFEVLIDRLADQHSTRWIEARRYLHANPEPSKEEFRTTEFVRQRLLAMGLDVRIPPRGLGVIAELQNGDVDDQPHVVAVRADMDALRMADRKSVPWASVCDGLAHSCGHDVHMTVVLAVAELLDHVIEEHRDELPPLHLRFVFQAAEETCEGASWMIEDGALAGVSSIIGLHVDPLIAAGKVGIRYGVLTAQVDEVVVDIRGKGGHVARPHHTTDPVAAAAMLISNLHQTIGRNVDALYPTVFTVGRINGGTASNIVPDHVSFSGTLRSTNRKIRERVQALIRCCCDAAASMTGNEITCEFHNPLGSVINDVTVASAMEASARQTIGDANVKLLDKPSMGGEDFAMYVEHVRGAQIRLGCAGVSEQGQSWPLLHSPVFDIDESAIEVGVRILARTALMLALMPRG